MLQGEPVSEQTSGGRPRGALGSTQFSGKQKGKQRVPSTLRFRKFPGKTEGVWCSILFLSSFPESESWSGAKSEAKLRKSTKYPGGRRANSRYTRVLRKIPGILPIWPKIWLILGPNQPQTRLRAQNLTISTEFSRENREEKRGCCRENRKGKQMGCERKTSLSPSRGAEGTSDVHDVGVERGVPGGQPAAVVAPVPVRAIEVFEERQRARHLCCADVAWDAPG